MSPNENLSEYTLSVAEVAKELNVPILALSQLSRQVESRDDKRPVENSEVVAPQVTAASERDGMAGMDTAAMLLDAAEQDLR